MTTRKLSSAFFLLAVLFSTLSPLEAMEFVYKFNTGDKYRIVATVTEDVYVDRRLTYKAEILTRIAMEVTGVSGGWARQAAIFQSAEKTVAVGGGRAAGTFQWAKDYDSVFEQDKLGYITIEDQYFMPMVRDVPVFPGRDLAEGDTWSAGGMEVYDFRDNYGITQPYRIPFTADYKYLGERTWKGKNYPAFSVSYRIFMEPQAVPGKVYPRRIQEASDQIIYWDEEHGQPAANEEHCRTIIDLSDGQTWEYRGRAEGEVIEAPPMDKEDMAKDIAQDIAGIPDASVRVTGEGIVISLENIQFAADSAILRPSERPKLDIIAEILMKYPDRDILVGGHTALAGTASARMQLSRERAASVAEYLLSKKVRTPERVVIRGYGAEQSIADNRTPEGMARNRRVEIIILEN
jgi:outer membrane protein OmpA-like peptidoglycan-associated protein